MDGMNTMDGMDESGREDGARAFRVVGVLRGPAAHFALKVIFRV